MQGYVWYVARGLRVGCAGWCVRGCGSALWGYTQYTRMGLISSGPESSLSSKYLSADRLTNLRNLLPLHNEHYLASISYMLKRRSNWHCNAGSWTLGQKWVLHSPQQIGLCRWGPYFSFPAQHYERTSHLTPSFGVGELHFPLPPT